MKKYFLTISMLVIFGVSQAQDGHIWTFRFKFKLDLNDKPDYEFFLNEELAFLNYRGSDISFDPVKKQYTLTVHYNCISCDYSGSNLPPQLYIKVNREDNFTKTKFSGFIPIYFEQSDDWSFKEMDDDNIEAIDLGTFGLEAILKYRGVTPPMNVFEVRADRSLHLRNESECKLKKMARLIAVGAKP